MKKIFIFFAIFSLTSVHALAGETFVQKRNAKEMSFAIDYLMQKTYSKALFSPEDYAMMMNYKAFLDSKSDPKAYAPAYRKLARLFELREMDNEALECLEAIK